MTKLWLTDRAYRFFPALIRIVYWLAAISISSFYVNSYSQQDSFKFGLMLISLLFVVGFIFLARILDHLFKTTKK